MSSPKIARDEVLRIARLARLAPDEAQMQALQHDLSRVLEYVNKLSEVDTSAVEATPSTVRAVTLRVDELVPSLEREAALSQAPAARDGGFSVPKVLETDS
ncbi:MAG TPA: Asp-tRNA(Asn)/Glu-tRNA(Gln) amidotransferase subunit GatC [Polyangiales bacterium]|nr:Asp-tRNA(Asn)/Glu-tRNA(Gln) amidotransferase subunit GatC [Polyangiales bacterium]